MIMGMCNWLHRWYRKGGRLDTATLARQYASAALDGILSHPSQRLSGPSPRYNPLAEGEG